MSDTVIVLVVPATPATAPQWVYVTLPPPQTIIEAVARGSR